LAVNHTDDVFEALDLQDDLQCKYTGGTVFHTFVGEKLSKDAVRTMVKKISNNYHLPYFTITPTFSICPIHGYLAGEHEYCPKCDADIAEAEAHTTPVAKDVLPEVQPEEIAEAPIAEAPVVVAPVAEVPVLKVANVVVEDNLSAPSVSSVNFESQLNFGGDANGEN